MRTVNVFVHDDMTVGGCKLMADFELAFNGLFRLIVTGETGINDNVHSLLSSLSI